jgi:hypothetical protein
MYAGSIKLKLSGHFVKSKFKNFISEPEVAPRNLHAAVYQPDSSLSIEWDKLSCEDTRAYIHNYVVYICPSDKGENCSGMI